MTGSAAPTDRPTGRVVPGATRARAKDVQATTTVGASSVPPSTNRPRAGRARLSRERLGSRDIAVLESLAKLRLLSGGQVQRLHVAEGSRITQARRTRALLQRLADLKLVVRLGRQVGGIRAGSSGYVYGLSGNGQAVLTVDGPMGGRRRRVWETSPSFQDHVLLVAEVYIWLVEAERSGHVELLDFDAEPACWRRFPATVGGTVTLKPDAMVRIGVGDVERSAFVEVDLGTESVPTIARKCAVYVAYWRCGLEQQRRGVFPKVVWLTTNARRAGRITEVVRRLPAETRALFAVGLLTEAVTVIAGERAAS